MLKHPHRSPDPPGPTRCLKVLSKRVKRTLNKKRISRTKTNNTTTPEQAKKEAAMTQASKQEREKGRKQERKKDSKTTATHEGWNKTNRTRNRSKIKKKQLKNNHMRSKNQITKRIAKTKKNDANVGTNPGSVLLIAEFPYRLYSVDQRLRTLETWCGHGCESVLCFSRVLGSALDSSNERVPRGRLNLSRGNLFIMKSSWKDQDNDAYTCFPDILPVMRDQVCFCLSLSLSLSVVLSLFSVCLHCLLQEPTTTASDERRRKRHTGRKDMHNKSKWMTKHTVNEKRSKEEGWLIEMERKYVDFWHWTRSQSKEQECEGVDRI